MNFLCVGAYDLVALEGIGYPAATAKAGCSVFCVSGRNALSPEAAATADILPAVPLPEGTTESVSATLSFPDD